MNVWKSHSISAWEIYLRTRSMFVTSQVKSRYKKTPAKSQSLSDSSIEVFANENCWMGGLFKKRGEKWKTSVLPGLHRGVPASDVMTSLAHTRKTSRCISRIHNIVPLGVIGVEYGIQIMSTYEVFKGRYLYRWKMRGLSTEPCEHHILKRSCL